MDCIGVSLSACLPGPGITPLPQRLSASGKLGPQNNVTQYNRQSTSITTGADSRYRLQCCGHGKRDLLLWPSDFDSGGANTWKIKPPKKGRKTSAGAYWDNPADAALLSQSIL